jgi:hypothetical protein
MQRRQRIRLLWAAWGALALASGCTTDAGGSMYIVHNKVPSEGCVVPDDDEAPFRGTGRIDTNAGAGYVFTPLVKSLVQESGNDSNPRVIAMRGADVDISFTSGPFDEADEARLRDMRLTRFSTAFSGSVFPTGQTSFAFVVVPAGLLTEIAATGESAQLSVEVSVFGDLDGADVDSVPFVYPIEVCNGCLTVDQGDCAGLADTFEPRDTNTCNPAQDEAADCCSAGSGWVCLAPEST